MKKRNVSGVFASLLLVSLPFAAYSSASNGELIENIKNLGTKEDANPSDKKKVEKKKVELTSNSNAQFSIKGKIFGFIGACASLFGVFKVSSMVGRAGEGKMDETRFSNNENNNNGNGFGEKPSVTQQDIINACINGSVAYSTNFLKKYGYSGNYSDYDDPETFANFRPFKCNGCKEGLIYFGASPYQKENGRASCVSAIAQSRNIGFEINLESDDKGNTPFDYTVIFNNSDYFSKFHNNNGNYSMNISMRGISKPKKCGGSIVAGLKGILNYWRTHGTDKPVYIHCTEGRTRTGYFSAILGLLMGKEIEELKRDFVSSYNNYYKNCAKGKACYKRSFFSRGYWYDLWYNTESSEVEAFNGFLKLIKEASGGNCSETSSEARSNMARKYLVEYGMKDSEIDTLKSFLIK